MGATTVIFRQYQLGCLSLFSYLIGDDTTGRAVIVDPQRDVGGYLRDAEAGGLRIERVIETHLHADYVSGHLELAAATGAAISYGDAAVTEFPIEPLVHGQRLPLGETVLEIRRTPGHTPESISVVVWEHDGDDTPWGVLTGDALFIGDVGRPDLLASTGFTADALARQLFRSLHEQLMSLPDGTRVFPAHGAGSACGKHLSASSESTIGEQRATNYALRPMSEDDFVAIVTEGQAVAPAYFAFAADTNRRERDLLDDSRAPKALTLDETIAAAAEGSTIVDTRPPEGFASGHIRGAINVGLDGRFAEYAGDVIRPGSPIVLVTDPGHEVEARVRLARIGFDDVVGHLPGIDAVLADHPELAAVAHRLPAHEAAAWLTDDPAVQILDVRSPAEWEDGVVAGAVGLPLAQILDRLAEIDPDAPTIVYCAGGYRSSIAASLLRARGFTRVADILGGYPAYRSGSEGVHRAGAS